MRAFERIELPADQLADITMHQKDWGEPWVHGAIRQRQAKLYVAQHLELVKEESKYGTPFNCYHEGHEVYRRQDGKPITQDDLDTLDAFRNGQGNKVIGQVGDLKVVREWFCDSGD